VRPHREAVLGKLVVQGQEAVLEPGALDLHVKVPEADLQELLVGQRGPGEFLAHRCANLEQIMGRMVSRRGCGDNRRTGPWRRRPYQFSLRRPACYDGPSRQVAMPATKNGLAQ
jgi:hypothetical protein